MELPSQSSSRTGSWWPGELHVTSLPPEVTHTSCAMNSESAWTDHPGQGSHLPGTEVCPRTLDPMSTVDRCEPQGPTLGASSRKKNFLV